MNNIISIREQLGLSQAEFAEEIKVTQGNVSHYECGRQDVPPSVARLVIEACSRHGVDISFDDIYAASETKRV